MSCWGSYLTPTYRADPTGLFWDLVDIGFFGQSAYNYSQCPSRDNAINLGLDAVGLLPGIPALGTIKRINDAVDAAKKAGNLADRLGADTPPRQNSCRLKFLKKKI